MDSNYSEIKEVTKQNTSRDNKLLMHAFTVYVRPMLEYNSVIWSSCTAQI